MITVRAVPFLASLEESPGNFFRFDVGRGLEMTHVLQKRVSGSHALSNFPQ